MRNMGPHFGGCAHVEDLTAGAFHKLVARLSGSPTRRVWLKTSIEERILCCGPGRVAPPFLEIGLGAQREISAPRLFEASPGVVKGCRRAVSILTRMAPRIEAAMPFPAIGTGRVSRTLRDCPCADTGIVDVPGYRLIVDALAGDLGHGGTQTRSKSPGNQPEVVGFGVDQNRVANLVAERQTIKNRSATLT
jgi:hypothetical protein